MLGVERAPGQMQEADHALDHTDAACSHRQVHRLPPLPGQIGDFRIAAHVRHVALVELNDQRHLLQGQPVLLEVVSQVHERLGVVLCLRRSRIGDEGDPVSPLHHQSAGRSVNHLPGNGENLEPHRQISLTAKGEWQQIEEQRSVVLGLERHQTPTRAWLGRPV